MKEEIKKIEKWIKDYVQKYAKGVVIGMSGGKDSLITAKLCADAIGKENVLGLIMPNGEMKDCTIAEKSCELIGIRYYIININNLYNSIIESTENIAKVEGRELSSVTSLNTPPRLRMTTLYAIAGSLDYLVANTSNLSESMIGYTTKWGDNVGDFSPLANFTKEEVCEIGIALGLPEELVYKTPNDGLSGLSDEEKLGFSYQELDSFIRNGIIGDRYDKISKMNKLSGHKRNGVVKYPYNGKNHFE